MASEHRSWWPEWRCSRSARPASVPANWSASDYAWPQITLYPVPQLYGGRLLGRWRWLSSAARVPHRDERCPDELTLWAQFLQFPPITEVPEPLRGGSFIAVDVAYLGSADDVAPLLALFRACLL